VQFEMGVDGGESEVKSNMGTFCTLILFFITILYAWQKLGIL